MAHGERLPGQDAIGDDAAEQLALFHGRQQEANGARLLGQGDQGVVVMDVVDFAGVVLQIRVQEALQRADGQLALCLVEVDRAALLADVPLDGETALSAPGRLQLSQELLGIRARDDAVDGLKDLGLIVNILQLNLACLAIA